MKNQFADYETSKTLKKLGFQEDCIAYHSHNVLVMGKASFINMKPHWENTFLAPLWQQVKVWLWNKHKMYIKLEYSISVNAFLCKPIILKEGKINCIESNSPILAEEDAIKYAVKYLSDTAVAVTPINTNANGA